MNKIAQHKTKIFIFLILLLSMFLRFYNYHERWGLAYDQAHDAVLARYSLSAHKIPLLGPFSSAGPFQTGGEWYWFIMIGYLLYPNPVITPWVFLTFLYVVFVVAMIYLGKKLIDTRFGLILGLISAVSTAQIAQSTNLTNQSPLAIISWFTILFSILFIKKKTLRYLFFLGFFTSLAITIHLQGVPLLLFVFVTIIVGGFVNLKGMLLLSLGFLIPLMPLLIFDLQSNFVNILGMIQYYLYDQYKIPYEVLGRRWLTYLGVFWPNSWSHIIGAKTIIGYILIFCLMIMSGFSVFKKRMAREWYPIIIGFFAMVIILRYVRTTLFDSYIVFLHPFVILLTGWVIYNFYNKSRILALLMLFIIVGASLHRDIIEIRSGENYAAKEASMRVKRLFQLFPNQKFAVYDYHYKWADKNLILSLFLDVNEAIDDRGRRVGVVVATRSGEFAYPIISGEKMGYQLLDLNSSTITQLTDNGWVLVNPSAIYKATEEWYKGRK